MPHPTHMSPADTGLLVIDVQDKLLTKIPMADALVRNVAFLVDGARLLNLPVQATEQYPKGLGPSNVEISKRIAERPEKTAFSCCAIPSVVEKFHAGGRTKLVLAGMETHVCVMNTALDLMAQGFRVYLPVDAVASRFAIDHDMALRRLEHEGAILTTAETCVFEWVGGAHHPQFKAVSGLIQERMKTL